MQRQRERDGVGIWSVLSSMVLSPEEKGRRGVWRVEHFLMCSNIPQGCDLK